MKNLPKPYVSRYPKKNSKQEIIMGILIMICGLLIFLVSNYLIKINTTGDNIHAKIAWLVGLLLIGGGFVILLIGIFFRQFIKWDMKRTTGASQIAEGSDGEYIEVYEEN